MKNLRYHRQAGELHSPKCERSSYNLIGIFGRHQIGKKAKRLPTILYSNAFISFILRLHLDGSMPERRVRNRYLNTAGIKPG